MEIRGEVLLEKEDLRSSAFFFFLLFFKKTNVLWTCVCLCTQLFVKQLNANGQYVSLCSPAPCTSPYIDVS